MKITSIETIPVRLPRKSRLAIRSSLGYALASTFVLVKVHADDGIVGLGEVSCDPIWSGEDYLTSARYINDMLAPLLIGENPTEIERLTAKLRTRMAGNPFTKSAINFLRDSG